MEERNGTSFFDRITMTERCQNKFTENFDNPNSIICAGIFFGSLAVFYFYRFHFATAAFSYILGCLVCYYGLNSHILHDYVERFKCHISENSLNQPLEDVPVNGCETCGSKGCARHNPAFTADPWVGLQIHKQLDQAIEDFYNTILEQFISSWYSKITLQPFFVDELRYQLRYASACLLRRAVKINYSRFITERLLPCALRHYTLCSTSPDGGPLLDNKLAMHPAAANRNAELKYLRAITNAIMPYLLRNNELESSVFRVLIREIFAGWVLLALTDVLADPHILNTLVVLATGNETMAELPTSPNYRVEFLETFTRQTESLYAQRSKLLRIDLELVMNEQDYLYAFMQYMKTTSHIHLLQFYRDINSFQTKILNPDLSTDEEARLHAVAVALYDQYCTGNIPASLVPLAGELKELKNGPARNVRRLQTSRALYQAARQSHADLEKIMLPKFLHSEEFYKLLIGSRIPTGFQKQMVKKRQEKLLQTALKLGHKLKGALRTQTLDGQVLECYNNLETSDSDSVDNLDILNYLDSIATDESLREQDLSTYKVVLTNVETRLNMPPRRGTVRVFTMAVHRAATTAGAAGSGARLWTTERSEHDFHLLRSKLHEFHGDRLLHDMPLPSRRDNSPLETLRYKYEDFIQRLLQKSLLQTSELLHLFLTVDGDFSMIVQASTLNANSTDLVNIYQSVTHRLRKEKGQHLENFLRNMLVSSDMERYQALKQGVHIEEALELNEETEIEQVQERPSSKRVIVGGVFADNFGVEPIVVPGSGAYQTTVVGFTQCLMFLLTKVVKARAFVTGIVGTLISMMQDVTDHMFNVFLNRTLIEIVSERRLAHLIKLGHGLLFGKRNTSPRTDPITQRELARRQLLNSIPSSARFLLGSSLPAAVNKTFEIVQVPQLNKQLVYNLLDLCILEIFPELRATSPPQSRS